MTPSSSTVRRRRPSTAVVIPKAAVQSSDKPPEGAADDDAVDFDAITLVTVEEPLLDTEAPSSAAHSSSLGGDTTHEGWGTHGQTDAEERDQSASK
eukprot:CAMPEP_0118919714 /NCGR_PEP_ID=MMETSP1166-20130328/18700_1 /TAXON_ID=1104430 /ORGANISM="Chrysoreinhardia sp, Strain CCMP3193" /LENGTH=95 /DNA_ID=CAMNT_0006860243 /DNA_START=21 /DNA_END=309 /DNA_ORIENTATION=+